MVESLATLGEMAEGWSEMNSRRFRKNRDEEIDIMADRLYNEIMHMRSADAIDVIYRTLLQAYRLEIPLQNEEVDEIIEELVREKLRLIGWI